MRAAQASPCLSDCGRPCTGWATLRFLAAGVFALAGLLFLPEPAMAGMPQPALSHLARLRLQDISFFIVVILLCAAVVRMLWNGLSKDFTRLPRITYLRALGATLLWGLMFILVLTMISGARELMTPGAWEPEGGTYRLDDPRPERLPPFSDREPEGPRKGARE